MMINDSDEDTIIYNKKYDMQSLRIIMYILFCGYTPFSVHYGYEYSGDKEENCTVCQKSLFQNTSRVTSSSQRLTGLRSI